MKALRLLLALTLAWLLCAPESRADAFGNRAWGKSEYQSVITPSDEAQTLVRYRENATGYDEIASGQEVWTKFDPDGRQTMDPVSPGNLLPALTVIALTGIVVDIGYHDVKNYLHPSSPAPSSDQSPAPAAAAPTKQPAAAQPSAAPPPPNGGGDDGDKSSNKNKSAGDNPEGSAQADKKAGAYKDLQDVGDGQDAHHMPSSEALKETDISKSDGPSIKMDPADHMKTESWGSSADAQAYRAKQAELIKQGDFKGATQMDYDDLQSKFGDKYYEHIQEHQNYVESLPKEDLQPKADPPPNS